MYRYYLYHPDLKQPIKLKHDPVGWDSLGKSIKRDPQWHGVMFEYTPKLQFIKDGKAIIHTLYELYGPEAEIIILIDEFNPVSRKFERDYTGRLNLTTLEISTLYATCNIENTGFVQKFKNRHDVKVNLQSLVDLDGNPITPFSAESRSIELHSKTVKKVQHLNRTDAGAIVSEHFGTDVFWYVQTSLKPELDEIGEYFDYIDAFVNTKLEDDLKYHLKVDEVSAGVYSFDLKFKIKVRSFVNSVNAYNIHVKLYLKHRNFQTGVLTEYVDDVLDYARPFADPFTYDSGWLDAALLVNNLTLNVGDEIYFYWRFENDSSSQVYDEFLFDTTVDNYFKATVLSMFPASNANLVLKHEAWARIFQSILGVADPLRSEYYGRTDSEPNTYLADGEGSVRGITNGFQVRGFPLADRPIHASAKEMFESCRAIDGVGIGIETIDGKQYVVIEALDHFYQSIELMQLDFVKDITKECASDYYNNELEIGYRKWADQKINNLDEFNTKREYSLPITQIKNKLMLISPYIGSGYLIEFVRRDAYTISNTKDNANDNENFVIQLRRNGATFETDIDQDFETISNVLSSDTIYNAKLSIGRCVRRNGKLISSFLQKQMGKTLRLTYSEGNKELVSKLTAEQAAIDDGADIAIADLDNPLWLPEIYKFKASLTRSQIASMNANPYGYISFSNTDKDHKKCYILEAERDPKSSLVTFIALKANL